MLLRRIATAIVLLALLIPALLASARWPFATVTLALVAAAGWEWSRLNGRPGLPAYGFAAVLAALCGAALLVGWAPAAASWWGVVALWVGGAIVALRRGPSWWPTLPLALRLCAGLLMLLAAWLALVQARAQGVNFVLSVFALVWVADIAAYAGGRAFGRRKLAPTISPGKTWEGAASGLVGVVLLALAWHAFDAGGGGDGPSLYTRLPAALGTVGAALGLIALVAGSVTGDLFESLVKRAAGAKDSSGLLPGHGGVLDRIDALLPVFPAALALARTGAGS